MDISHFMQVGTTPSSLVDIPAPDDISVTFSDVSAPDAGRDQTARMYKRLVARKRTIAPTWKNRGDTEIHEILNAFWPEYVYVRYWDPKDGAYATREFYTGDKQTAFQSVTIAGVVYSQLSFSVIER